MATSPNGVEYTHSTYIQDIDLIEDVELGRRSNAESVTFGSERRVVRITANPGVWYIDNPLNVRVGDGISFEMDNRPRYRIVDIGEYPPQPTLRTLYMVIPEDAK